MRKARWRGAVVGRSMVVGAGLLALGAGVPAQTVLLSDVGGGVPGFNLLAAATDDRLGAAVAPAGDVNGDGIGDLIVGSPAADPSGGNDNGVAYVVFGKSTNSGVVLSDIQSGAGGGFAIVGNPDLFPEGTGTAVSSVGDMNGDGLADVLVSSPFDGMGAFSPNGAVFVVFGKTSPSPVSLSALGTGGFAVVGAGSTQAGTSAASIGDFNADGLNDMALSIATGTVYVVYGRTATSTIQLSSFTSGTTGIVINPATGGDGNGRSLAGAGDVNGDGLADLIVGAYLSSAIASQAGVAYVVFGGTSNTGVDLSALGLRGFRITSPIANGNLGTSVSGAGDMNGDGLADVIVGAPRLNAGYGVDSGRAFVVFGRTGTGDVDTSFLGGSIGFAINSSAAGDRLGQAVGSAGDHNGDGLGDVIVGAYRADNLAGTDAGEAYVIFGRTGVVPDISVNALGSLGFRIEGAAANDQAGRALSPVGDVSGDGLPDFLIGAPGTAVNDPGKGHVVFGTATPPASSTYVAHARAGDAPLLGPGAGTWGDDLVQPSDSRLWIDFSGGSGPGIDGASSVTATVTRNTTGITDFGPAALANVRWQLASNRAGWAPARVTVRYTNAEITGRNEADLKIYTATSVAGPFSLASSQSLDMARNRASADINTLPAVIVLSVAPPDNVPPTATITRLLANPTANQVPSWSVVFSEPVSNTFDAPDITPIGTLSGSVGLVSVTGSSPNFTVKLATETENASGTLGFNLAAGAVTDAGTNPSALTPSPTYTINEGAGGGLAGDVDKNGTVNVADVTLLSNFIVNGGPPLP